MRILGIDPGLQTTGFGVIDVNGSQLTYVASGVIRTDKVNQGNLPNRLRPRSRMSLSIRVAGSMTSSW